MSIIGEAVLTATVEMLFKKLASSELLQFARQEKIKADLMEWEKILVKIHALLEDAEEKQMTNALVKSWLGDLKNLASDVEDILDEFETELSKRKWLHSDPQHSTSKVRKLIPTCCTSFTPRSVKFSFRMISEIKEITTRFHNIATVKDRLDLRESSVERSKRVIKRLPTTSLVNEAKVYGREKDKKAIVELLLKDDSSTEGVSIVPIIGMGGVGKTTLAQLVFNDASVKNHFHPRAWVCVSENFDVVSVTKTILQSVATPKIDGVNDLNMLQVKLKEELSKKKFLLVLDDVWDENYEKWTVFCSPFEAASPGSKIIITARNRGVSLMMKADIEYPLDKLTNDDCLHVFAQHSLGVKDFTAEDKDLKEIGEKIVRRCNGLPLAAKALGGLLRGKSDIKDWKDVLNCKIWDLSEEKCNIIPALRVSYYYLPPHLKQCFEFCSLFPKNYIFEEEKVILLWMGIGFLQYETSEKQVEDLGRKYFRELQSRSFFQKLSQNKSQFVMHDLIHDLAQWTARETYFMVEDKHWCDNPCYFSKTLRHLSYNIDSSLYEIESLEASNVMNQLRTLFVQKWYYSSSSLLKLRRIRVLSLHGYSLHELPNRIGDLKHLRYLDLSYTDIKTLPESVSTLYNLRTLLLVGCKFLRVLCLDMGNLINLRHLDIQETRSLEQMPRRIGTLTDLQTLSKFVVSYGFGSRLAELKSLTHLRRRLHISGLENVYDADDAKKADLNGKENLNGLNLEWTRGVDVSRQAETQTQVLDMLRPHQNLSELIICGYAGKKFPIWLGDSLCLKLIRLKLSNCRKCISLPSLGQLRSLKDLVIERMEGIESVGPDFYGKSCSDPFPSLETLKFSDMKEWKDWIPCGAGQEVEGFPRLRKLLVFRCPKLKGSLPERLPSLEGLRIDECEQLSVSISSYSKLCELKIDGCKKVVWSTVDLNSLKSVVLSDVSNVLLAERFMQGLPKLPRLKQLTIRNCTEMKSFLENGMQNRDISTVPRLMIERCPSHVSSTAEEEEEQLQQEFTGGEDFPDPVSSQGVGPSSQMRFITIENCGGLKYLPEAWMSRSMRFVVKCYSLSSLISIARVQLPRNLNRLEIRTCHMLQTLVDEEEVPIMRGESNNGGSSSNTSLLKYLVIVDCDRLTSLWSKGELPATLRHIKVENCWNLLSLSSRGNLPRALTYLRIENCPKLESIVAKVHNNTFLERIEIYGCDNLKSLPDGLNKLSHLEEISVCNCPSVVHFPEGGLPATKLKGLNISACDKLQALPNGMNKLTHLEEISLRNCPCVVRFPEGGLPSKKLTRLNISACDKLVALPNGMNRLGHLEEISICNCPSVVRFPEGGLPSPKLRRLNISACDKLAALPNDLDELSNLEEISVCSCPSVVQFPEGGLPSTKLTRLNIRACDKLEALPNGMNSLTSLQYLSIESCPGIVSFPKDGFPTNIKSLKIRNMNICKRLFDWGLHRLTSLRELHIGGGCENVESFPQEEIGMTLPSSLTILLIEDFPDLVRLSSMSQYLTSLEKLSIFSCPKLKYLPEKSLSSLLKLSVENCPQLEESLKKDGQHWPRIAHVRTSACSASQDNIESSFSRSSSSSSLARP